MTPTNRDRAREIARIVYCRLDDGALAIAQALDEAERRGMERAAGICDAVKETYLEDQDARAVGAAVGAKRIRAAAAKLGDPPTARTGAEYVELSGEAARKHRKAIASFFETNPAPSRKEE